MAEQTTVEIPVVNLEYEIVNGRFNLYERGGKRYLSIDGCGLQSCINLRRKTLEILYPVAQVEATGNVQECLEKALSQFVELFDVCADFKFTLGVIGEKIPVIGSRGKVRVNGTVGDCKLEAIAFGNSY